MDLPIEEAIQLELAGIEAVIETLDDDEIPPLIPKCSSTTCFAARSNERARFERGDHGIWQPRYWEHTIRDEHDFDRHFDYVHYNPVKHGHVNCPGDWPASSFHRWVRAGVYDPEWGCASRGGLSFLDLDETAMELGVP